MKKISIKRSIGHVGMRKAGLLAAMIAGIGVVEVRAADQYFDGSTTNALNTAKWAATNAGPFTSSFTSGSTAVFSTVNGTGSGSTSIAVGGIRAEENFTISSASGTLTTGGTVATVNVFSGKKLDFTGVTLSTAAGTGFNKTGAGEWVITTGGTYSGGFTLTAGTMTVGGVNAMGGSVTNTLTINGGTLRTTTAAARDFTGKFGGGITIGGDFTIGAAANAGTGNTMTFSNNISLGSATRTITNDSNGNTVLSGVISNTSGGLTLTSTTGTNTGIINLVGANTYTGGTTLSSGGVAIGSSTSGSASALGSTSNTLTVNGGTLDLANFSQTVGQLTGSGGSITNSTTSTTSTLTVSGTDTTASAYAGTIVDGGSGKIVALVRGGTGKTILSGANTFTGGTSITGGTLVLGSSTTLQSATGLLTVSGGTLSSSVASTTIGGNLLLSGGTIDPNGASIGTIILSAAKTFTMSSGTLNIKLGTTFDKIQGGTGSTFSITGGTLALDVTDGSFSYASTYQIFTSFTGTSSNLAITGISGYTGSLSTSGVLSFTAIPVPEPSTYAAILGALILTGAVIRRRSRHG